MKVYITDNSISVKEAVQLHKHTLIDNFFTAMIYISMTGLAEII